jgi:hypothetical protein
MSAPMQEPKDWHLDKRLQITHVLMTASSIAYAVLYVGDIRKDVEIGKVQIAAQAARDNSQDKSMEQSRAESLARFERIDAKLDRLIEYTNRPNGRK